RREERARQEEAHRHEPARPEPPGLAEGALEAAVDVLEEHEADPPGRAGEGQREGGDDAGGGLHGEGRYPEQGREQRAGDTGTENGGPRGRGRRAIRKTNGDEELATEGAERGGTGERRSGSPRLLPLPAV